MGMYKKEGMSECKECGFGKEPNYLQTDCGLCFIPDLHSAIFEGSTSLDSPKNVDFIIEDVLHELSS